MLNILAQTYATLSGDQTLATLMGYTGNLPNTQIYTGRVDVVKEQASTIGLTMIVIKMVTETFRTVPYNVRDARIQIDIFSQNNELSVAEIYERIATLLNFQILNNNGTHIFWQRLDGATETYEREANIFHWTADMILWTT